METSAFKSSEKFFVSDTFAYSILPLSLAYCVLFYSSIRFGTDLLLPVLAFYLCIHSDNLNCFHMQMHLCQLFYLVLGFFF